MTVRGIRKAVEPRGTTRWRGVEAIIIHEPRFGSGVPAPAATLGNKGTRV